MENSTSAHKVGARQQKGIAAVEFAVVLPILVVMLAVPLFLAFVCWHYTVAEKAARDAARYLSSAPKAEMLAIAGGEIEAAKFAKSIADLEMSELKPGPFPIFVEAQCNGVTCLGNTPPTTVRVVVRMQVVDQFFPVVTDFLGTGEGIWLTADASMPYAGH
jgi:Flp pilus assembly protein TadG